MEPGNIWDYIYKAQTDLGSEKFNKKFVSDKKTATQMLQQVSKEAPQKPKDFNSYLTQMVGQTHKDMLLNAMDRMGVNKRLSDLVVGLDDRQVAKLLASYRKHPSFSKRFDAVNKKVGGWLDKRSKEFNPMESKDAFDPYAELLVEFGETQKRWLSNLGKRIKKRLTSDEVLLGQKGIEYETLARAINDDPHGFVQQLRKVGLNVKSEKPQQIRSTTEKEAVPAAEPAAAEPAAAEPAAAASKPWFTSKQKAKRAGERAKRLGRSGKDWLAKKREAAKAKWRKGLSSESYARAITNNIKIEEFRLAANDRARLALQIYAEECNSLNRHEIYRIYDREREEHFNRTLVEAIKYAHKYSQLLDEQDLKLQIFEPIPECWFESLVVLIEQTNNPFDAVEVNNFEMLLESYYTEHFHIVEREKVGYIPLSKII